MTKQKLNQKQKIEQKELKRALKLYAEFGLYSYIQHKTKKSAANIRFSTYVTKKTNRTTTRIELKKEYKKTYKVVRAYYDIENREYIKRPKKTDLSKPSVIAVPAIQNKKTKKIIYNPSERYVNKRKYIKKVFHYNKYFGIISAKKLKIPKLSQAELKKIDKEKIPKSNVKNKKLISKIIESIKKQSKRNINKQKEYIKKRYQREKKTTKDIKVISKINVKIDLIKYTEDTPQLTLIYSNHEEITDVKNIPSFNDMLMKMNPYNIKQLKKIVNREYADGFRVTYAYGYYVVYDAKTKMLYRKPIVFNPMMFF